MDKVAIMLSTYNGEKFLECQLKSILSQRNVNYDIFCRDDGSNDNTVNILNSYIKRQNIILGDNIGVTNSFLELLKVLNNNYEYYAFADQDDCWHCNKLINAINMIKSKSNCFIPTMYCSRVEYVDEYLSHLGYSPIPTNIFFENALVENIAIGCTVVINRTAKKLICSAIPRKALMHDWWIYLVMSSIGQVIYDDRPSMKYRQHNQNAVGGTNDYILKNIRKLLPFLKLIFSDKNRTTHQAHEFKMIFGEHLNKKQISNIDEFLNAKINFKDRLKLALSGKFHRQNAIDNIFYNIQVLLGKY